MTGRHAADNAHMRRAEEGASWADSWLTADDARAIRAEEAARPIGPALERMPRSAYVAMASARDRAAYRRAATRDRRRRALWWLAVLAALALGIAGLMLTAPIPGVG